MSAQPDTRLHVLDVLRGIALIGMFLVHFSNYAEGGGSADTFYQRIVALFFEERFWAMFAILFGIGFAIQFRRADMRGDDYLPKYLRRMAALAGFGWIAHGVFGFNVLLGYAAWGLTLPLFRKLSTRALIAALVLSAMSFQLYLFGQAVIGVSRLGESAYVAAQAAALKQNQAFREANRIAQDSTSFAAVVVARHQHMRWLYTQPYSFLPVNTMALFLLGVLGLRLGLFDRPEAHRRLIASLMIFGVASWVFETWMPDPQFSAGTSLLRQIALRRLWYGLGLVRAMWLAFTYIGAILLLVSWKPEWLRRLAPLGWAGRMALTNYILQVILIDLLFSKYSLGISVTPLAGAAMGIALFLVDAVFSRWWLTTHPYGPLEWLWRSATYAKWQPWLTVTPTLQSV